MQKPFVLINMSHNYKGIPPLLPMDIQCIQQINYSHIAVGVFILIVYNI